jgi:hypothetical protein
MSDPCTKRLFLDENIHCLYPCLTEYGYDVRVLPFEMRGMDDSEVFKYAQKDGRVFITINGKHFITLVLPRGLIRYYYGILWVKFQMNPTYSKKVALKIDRFLRDIKDVENKIFKIKRDSQCNVIIEQIINNGSYCKISY